MKILMVLTSHDKLGNTGRKTGFWLEEFAAPYFTFLDASTGSSRLMASIPGSDAIMRRGSEFPGSSRAMATGSVSPRPPSLNRGACR